MDYAYTAPPRVSTGIIYVNSETKFRDVTDGLSKTLLLSERDDNEDDPWTTKFPGYCVNPPCVSGVAWVLQPLCTTYFGINSGTLRPNAGIEAHHPGGANCSFGDGHVDFLSEEIDLVVLGRMGTRSESLDDPAWQ
jgi:prepilin-type processing-associated H-X9-DG protein